MDNTKKLVRRRTNATIESIGWKFARINWHQANINSFIMNKLNTLRAFALIVCLALVPSFAVAEILTLSNGDKITGKIKASNDQQIILESAYGDLTIPRAAILGLSKDAVSAQQPVQQADAKEDSEESEAKSAEIEDPAAPTPKERDPQWVTDYRNFIKDTLPEGWQFRLRGGLEYRQTTSSIFSFYSAFDIDKQWEYDHFAATLYYNYTTETSVDNIKSTTLDKYGADTTFRHDFSKNNTWYLQNILSYKRDMVKGIRDQVDEAVTFGYRFDIKRYNLTINIGPGPAVRYINATNFDTKWVCMAILQEDISWKISKIFTFEQNGYMGFNVQKPEEYSAYLKLALIAHVTEVMNIALRYSYDYDAVNADNAQKSEQSLMLSFEFPFNWKN